jgi:hypothetical protein
MGVMEAAEPRGSVTPKMTGPVSNKGLAPASRKVKEIIITPIAIIHRAIVAVVVTVVGYWTIRAGTSRQCE